MLPDILFLALLLLHEMLPTNFSVPHGGMKPVLVFELFPSGYEPLLSCADPSLDISQSRILEGPSARLIVTGSHVGVNGIISDSSEFLRSKSAWIS